MTQGSAGRIIGIVGGLGPAAHVDLEQKLIAASRRLLDIRRDQDFPEWLVSSLPRTPDRTAAFLGQEPDPVPLLCESIGRLERGGADFVIMACNTAHLFLDRIRDQVALPVLSLIEVTAEVAQRQAPGGAIGILATTGTVRSRLYHEALSARGLTPHSPLDLDEGDAVQLRDVMEAIYGPCVDGRHQGGGIKTEGPSPASRALLARAAQRLVERFDVDALIAGCTEIPLVFDEPEVAGRPLLDPTALIAEEALRVALGQRPLPA